MKLEKSSIQYIQKVTSVAQLVGIDQMIIEPGMVRGMHQDRTVAIIHSENVPVLLPNISFGLTRLDVLNSRLNLLNEQAEFTTEALIKDTTQYAFSLTFKSKGTKIDYRCADPSKIQAKKTINAPIEYRLKLTTELVNLLQKGASAMSADTITIISNSEGVSFEMVDNNNDVFKHVFAESVSDQDGQVTEAKFAHRYHAKLLLSIFKKEPEANFDVGSTGLLRIQVQGIGVYVIPLT